MFPSLLSIVLTFFIFACISLPVKTVQAGVLNEMDEAQDSAVQTTEQQGESSASDSTSSPNVYETTQETTAEESVKASEKTAETHQEMQPVSPVPASPESLYPSGIKDVLDLFPYEARPMSKHLSCTAPGVVLQALETRHKESGLWFHRYKQEQGAWRLIPYHVARQGVEKAQTCGEDGQGKCPSEPMQSAESTTFFVVGSVPWGVGRATFLEEFSLSPDGEACLLKQNRRWGFMPSEELTFWQASQAMHSAWRSYMEKILRLKHAGPDVTTQDVLAWPDPLMYTKAYLDLLPEVPFDRLRPGDIAWTKEGRIAFAAFGSDYFQNRKEAFFAWVRSSQGWIKLAETECRSYTWVRPVAEFWEGRPARFHTVGGHDKDLDGIYSGMDDCPFCAEDGIGVCETDGCPGNLKVDTVFKPGLQLSGGLLYTYPEALSQLGVGVALQHPRVSFDLGVSLIHNLDRTRLGMTIEPRFYFPSLTRGKLPLEWYIGALGGVIGTSYAKAEPHPARLYLLKSGINIVPIETQEQRLVVDIGLLGGLRQQTLSTINGAEKTQKEWTHFSGGGLVGLRWELR